jgi:hypothetical protein
VVCLNGATPIFNNNNIHGNVVFGIENTDPAVTIDARMNWWGDVSGPSGEGSGSGDAVSQYVDFGDHRSDPVHIYIGAETDRIYIPAGGQAVVTFGAANFTDPDDVINAAISDELDWLGGESQFTMEVTDTTFASRTFSIAAPADIQQETTDVILLDGASTNNSEWKHTDTLRAIAYNPEYAELIVWPDTVWLRPEEEYKFTAYGLDQHSREIELPAAPQWQTEAGDIDSEGIYTAPGNIGVYRITAELNGHTAEGYAEVIDTTLAIEDEIILANEYVQVYPNPARDAINFHIDREDPARLTLVISNTAGREVYNQPLPLAGSKSGEYELDCSGFATGVYYFRIIGGGSHYAGKFMILR